MVEQQDANDIRQKFGVNEGFLYNILFPENAPSMIMRKRGKTVSTATRICSIPDYPTPFYHFPVLIAWSQGPAGIGEGRLLASEANLLNGDF